MFYQTPHTKAAIAYLVLRVVKIGGATSTKIPYGLVPSWDVSCGSNPVPLVPLRKALVPPWFKEMEPRYRDSRVARNSALSTRYLAAFAAICLVSTIVLSIGALIMRSSNVFRRTNRASDLYLS